MDDEVRPAPSALAIHDLSCLGRCALTVVIPALSAMGVQAVPLPTAALSAHTGFEGTVADHLDGFMAACVGHFRALNVRFDAVYSGYLANPDQAALVKDIMVWQREKKALCLVDPAMADHGKLYRGLSEDMPKAMAALCKAADIITPNLTEARLMLGLSQWGDETDEKELNAIARGLSCETAVITGIRIGEGHFNAFREKGGAFSLCPYTLAHGRWHGTGDLFASVLLGALLQGDTLAEAVRRAGDFVTEVIAVSDKAGAPEPYGVQLELALPGLLNRTSRP